MSTSEYNPVEYMVAQGSKKLAESNVQVLRNTYITTAVIYVVTLFGVIFLRRPVNFVPFIYFQIPVAFCLLLIKLSGTPVYFPNPKNPKQLKLVRAGEDLRTDWIIQYYFDCLYITYFLNIAMIIFNTNKVWYAYSIVPVFAVYLMAMGIKALFW